MATTLRVLVSWFILFFVFLTPQLAVADQFPKIKSLYQLTEERVCHAVSTTLFVSSHHHGKGNKSRLNEENRGLSLTCYLDKEKNFYGTVGGLENSQFGATVFAGPGIRIRTPELFRITAEAGIEMPLIYYPVPKVNKGKFGLLPIRYLGLSIRLPEGMGSIELAQRRLGIFGVTKKKIDLYSIAWSYSF